MTASPRARGSDAAYWLPKMGLVAPPWTYALEWELRFELADQIRQRCYELSKGS